MKNVIAIKKPPHDLWGIVGRMTQAEQYQRAKTDEQRKTHPAPEMLYDFVLDDLDIEAARQVRTHLTYCPDCANDVIAIMRLEDDEEHEEEPSQNALLENLAMEYWEPRYAGMLVTAADIPKQEHWFDDQRIKVTTVWERARGAEPAYIWVKWEITVETAVTFHLCFVNPETRERLYEVNLGPRKAGEEVFASDELQFEPAATRWALTAWTEEIR